MIKNIRHSAFVTSNVKKMLKLYCDILGFKVVARGKISEEVATMFFSHCVLESGKSFYRNAEGFEYYKLAHCDNANCLLEFYYSKKGDYLRGKVGFNHLAITVDDVTELWIKFDVLEENGLNETKNELIGSISKIYQPNDKVRLFFFRDFDGNLIEVVEELK